MCTCMLCAVRQSETARWYVTTLSLAICACCVPWGVAHGTQDVYSNPCGKLRRSVVTSKPLCTLRSFLHRHKHAKYVTGDSNFSFHTKFP